MGDFKIGGSSLNDCKIGTTQVDKIYLGNNLLWSKTSGGFGRLYNGYVATDSRNIAPTGWHVPTESELNTLISYVGGSSIAGGKLKETGLIHWNSPNTGATNDYLMSLRAGGICGNLFVDIMNTAYIWSSTINGSNQIAKYAAYNSTVIGGLVSFRQSGYSIYLVRDDTNNTGFLVDNDGFVYPSVTIGSQVWAGPIKGVKYRDGSSVSIQSHSSGWESLTTDACCAYNNDLNNI